MTKQKRKFKQGDLVKDGGNAHWIVYQDEDNDGYCRIDKMNFSYGLVHASTLRLVRAIDAHDNILMLPPKVLKRLMKSPFPPCGTK